MGENWCSPRPQEAAALFAQAPVRWWFAGGWAIDLFLNASTRPHADLDIGCFRTDLAGMLEQLSGWDIRVAAQGRLTPVRRGLLLDSAAHGLWCRPARSLCWVLEILVEEDEGSDWIFRRDARIRRAAQDITACTSSGLRYLRPEIQLLYKSRNHRLHDDADFGAAWPLLDADARLWLTTQLRMISPEHPWLSLTSAG